MNETQINLFKKLSKSRLQDYQTFKKKDYQGVWFSIINKYPESAHFVYELIQNADDAEATVAHFELYKDKLVFRHNGRRHFDVTEEGVEPSGDINSITGIGYSFKPGQTNKIGKFGVGFKAVFQYTNTPEIYDDNFKFKIENYIIPILLDQDYPGRRRSETLFVFPFKHQTMSYRVIKERLESLRNPVLFLNHLEKITYCYESDNGLSDEVIYAKELQEKCGYDGIKVEKCRLIEPSTSNSIFLFSEDAHISGTNNLQVSVGFYYNDIEKKLITTSVQNVYCFFPTQESFSSCFISHAPFILTDNRQNLMPDVEENKDLVNQIANLATKAVLFLRNYGLDYGLKLIDENIFDIFPVYKERYYNKNIFEEAMEDAFLPFLVHESIFLSRNGVYLSKKSAWTVTPQELQQLLTKEQLNELIGDNSGNSDFLNWELAQRYLANYKSYFSINQLNSSLFAKKLSPEFMENQEQRWVLRLYSYLKNYAPALWRANTDTSQPLWFRYSPIIKTQNGEWLAPYTNFGVLNIYLSVTSEVIDKYNFVSSEYCNEPNALAFFKELGIKEPDKLDYIKSIILPKYEKSGITIENNILKEDFNFVFSYYNSLESESKQKEFINLIHSDFRVRTSDNELYSPQALYFKSLELINYFRAGEKEVNFFDDDFYIDTINTYGKAKVLEFVRLLGVDQYPAIIKDSYHFLPKRIATELESKDYVEQNVTDYFLHGFDSLIEKGRINKDISLYLWNEVIPAIDNKDYSMEVQCRARYKRTKDEYTFMSSFQYSLIHSPWLFDINGKLKSPADIYQEDLDEDYSRNKELFNFLSIRNKTKSILELGGTEQQQREQEFGAELMNLYSGMDLSLESMLKYAKDAIQVKLQALKKEQENKKRAERESSDNLLPEEPEEEKL